MPHACHRHLETSTSLPLTTLPVALNVLLGASSPAASGREDRRAGQHSVRCPTGARCTLPISLPAPSETQGWQVTERCGVSVGRCDWDTVTPLRRQLPCDCLPATAAQPCTEQGPAAQTGKTCSRPLSARTSRGVPSLRQPRLQPLHIPSAQTVSHRPCLAHTCSPFKVQLTGLCAGGPGLTCTA